MTELTHQVAGYIPRWFNHLMTVTHPSTTQARRHLTLLMRPKMLPTKPNRESQNCCPAAYCKGYQKQ